MDHVEIVQQHDVIYVERYTQQGVIKNGSHLFCGLCGETIARVIRDVQIPCSIEDFFRSTADRQFRLEGRGMFHNTCSTVMFQNSKMWAFVSADLASDPELKSILAALELPHADGNPVVYEKTEIDEGATFSQAQVLVLKQMEAHLKAQGVEIDISIDPNTSKVRIELPKQQSFKRAINENQMEIDAMKKEYEKLQHERRKLPLYNYYFVRDAFVMGASRTYPSFEAFIKELEK